jgi:site-specific recombinase XerD
MVDFEDVDMTAGTMYVRHGKGGKQRLIGVGAEARACLWEYFVKKRGMRPGPLFIARGGVRLSAGAMADVLEDLRKLANTDITSHQFRRHAAARMLSQGAPLDVVMGQLGHSAATMSLMYGRAGRESRNIETFHALEAGVRPLKRAR